MNLFIHQNKQKLAINNTLISVAFTYINLQNISKLQKY